jgi:hypothetical protein
MKIADEALETFSQHVRVDLRRRDIGMAEEGLHRPQVRTVL